MSRRARKALKMAMPPEFRKVKLGCCGLEVTAANLHALAHAPGCPAPGRTAEGRGHAFARGVMQGVGRVAGQWALAAEAAQAASESIDLFKEAAIDLAADFKARNTASVDYGQPQG